MQDSETELAGTGPTFQAARGPVPGGDNGRGALIGNPIQRMPAELPVVELSPEELREAYGIPEQELPRALRTVLDNYVRWCTSDVNLSRSSSYTNAVQSTTIAKNRSTIRGYLGFCALRMDVPVKELRLSLYADADQFIAFIAYLRARGVGKAQLTKQVRTSPLASSAPL